MKTLFELLLQNGRSEGEDRQTVNPSFHRTFISSQRLKLQSQL